ncbi:DNA-binding transcriptional regulator CsgD, partial [Salmonella enterica subsp. enterica serovar Heidelberg str. RI-11-013193]
MKKWRVMNREAISALLQHLKQSLAITGKLHNIQRSLEDISASCIVLMDMMEADKKLIH